MIQDDKRENQLIKLFGLKQPKNRKRADIDAYLTLSNLKRIKFELKSTTVGGVSTASPLTLDHIQKWRDFHWIIGIYNKKAKLQYCVYASPEMMKKWLDDVEENVQRGLTLSHMIVPKINKKMLYAIFGNKEVYSYEQAKKVFGKLFSKQQYKDFKDKPLGYSKKVMLEMFKKHNLYYLIKGSWLNNPKIPKTYYKNWIKIKGNYKKELRRILTCE